MRNLTEFGAFLEIEEGFDGLIHVSDISWTGRVKNPGEVFKKGDTVEAKVLKIDAVNRRVSLGVKQLNDIWANWFTTHKINDVVHGKVSRLTTFGAFVELAEGVEGLCHISEIEDRRSRDKQAPPAQKGTCGGAGSRPRVRFQDCQNQSRSAQDRPELPGRGQAASGAKWKNTGRRILLPRRRLATRSWRSATS